MPRKTMIEAIRGAMDVCASSRWNNAVAYDQYDRGSSHGSD